MENIKELDMRIQRTDNLNIVEYDDTPGPGGGRHNYTIKRADTGEVLCTIQFQNGARREDGSIAGVLDEDFLQERTPALLRTSRKPSCGRTSVKRTGRREGYSASTKSRR